MWRAPYGWLFIPNIEIFKTYNEVTKHYIVMAVTVQDLLNDLRYKDNKSLILLTRPDIIKPKKPRKRRKSKLDVLGEKIDLIADKINAIEVRLDKVEARLDKIEARLDKIEARLDNIVKLNNLKE